MLTKQRIQNAYITLRRQHTLDQIRVTELCQIAKTNRTTFYHYYNDIYDLTNAVEDSLLKEALSGFKYRGLIYDDPQQYFQEFYKALLPIQKDLDLLGQGREANQYVKIERWLVELAMKDTSNSEEEVFMTFVIGGVVHTVFENRTSKKYSEEYYTRQLKRILRYVMKMKQ